MESDDCNGHDFELEDIETMMLAYHEIISYMADSIDKIADLIETIDEKVEVLLEQRNDCR